METPVITDTSSEQAAPEVVTTTVPAATEQTPSTTPETPAPAAPPVELDEKARLKIINEALGSNYKSLEEAKPKAVLTPEQKAAQQEEKERKALEWGISSGKVSREAIEKAAVVRAKDKREIALGLFSDEILAVSPSTKPEEIEELFRDFYHEHAELESPTRKMALSRMESMVNNHVKGLTEPVDSLHTDYDKYLAQEGSYNSYASKVKEVTKAIPKEIPFTMTYKAIDGSDMPLEFNMPVDEKTIKSIREEFGHENAYYALGAHENDGYESELEKEISTTVRQRVFEQNAQAIFQDFLNKAETNREAILRNIPATGTSRYVPNAPATPGKQLQHTHNRSASARRRPA